MQIDLRTVQIKPLRRTYDHIARRLVTSPRAVIKRRPATCTGGHQFPLSSVLGS